MTRHELRVEEISVTTVDKGTGAPYRRFFDNGIDHSAVPDLPKYWRAMEASSVPELDHHERTTDVGRPRFAI